MSAGNRGECGIPPRGWYCTREPEHDGPCCAWPTAALVERFKLAAKTLIRERVVYAEDVESMYDVLRALEALAATPPLAGGGA
jgi:hypothetical protein